MSDAHRDDIAKLESLYAQNPEGRIFTHLAEAYRKAGELERAREVLAGGIERHPDYSSAHVVLGRVLLDLGQHDEARSEFRRVLELDGQNLVALRSLGDIARVRGRDEEALEYYERLLDQEPSDDEVREIVGIMTGAIPVEEEPPAPDEAAAVEEAAAERGSAGEWGSAGEPADELEEETSYEEALEEETGYEEALYEETGAVDDVDRPEDGTGLEAEPAAEGEVEVEEVASSWEAGAAPETEDEGAEEGEPWTVAGDLDDEWTTGSDDEAVGYEVGEDADTDWPFESGETADEAEEELEPEEPGDADVMTETIAQVYARQGLYDRAVEVYQGLIRARPDDEGLKERLAEIEAQAAAEAAEAEAGEEAEEAWPESSEAEEAWPESSEAEEAGVEPAEVEPEEPETWAGEYSRDDDFGMGLDIEPEFLSPTDDDADAEAEAEAGEASEVEDHLEGFEAVELDTAPAEEVAPIEGLESQDVEPDTGLVVTPEEEAGEAGEEPVPWEIPEEALDEALGEGGEVLEGEETEAHESPWMEEDWSGEEEAETPYAWAETEEEPEDDSPPIHDYLKGLLSWGDGVAPATPEAGLGEAVEPAGGTEAAGAGDPDAGTEGPRDRDAGDGSDGDDDDDREMFRSWLESLKE